jgi:pyridoxal phosphate enzyme (YggS family)
MGASGDRRAELAAALAEVRERIHAAASAANRDPAQVTLVAVTKTFPARDAALLADLGIGDLGENRDQEAAAKTAEFARLRPDAALRWHMVGRLQRNKARSVVGWADVVQSVDSERLAEALDRATLAALRDGSRRRPLDVLVQVSLDTAEAARHRGGCPPAGVPALAEYVASAEGLVLGGVMAVAPLGADPEPAFERLAAVAARMRESHPAAGAVSAGMTGDFETAITYGSTCVRVGTALLGRRPLASP